MKNMFNKVRIATEYKSIKTETKKKKEDDRLKVYLINAIAKHVPTSLSDVVCPLSPAFLHPSSSTT